MLTSAISIFKTALDTFSQVGRITEAKKKKRKDYFDNFIAPLYLDIQNLHVYYLSILENILGYINDPNCNSRKIIEDLDKEIIFKSTNRSSTEAQLVSFLNSEKKIKLVDDKHLKSFISSIYIYLTCPKTCRFLTPEYFSDCLDVIPGETKIDPFKLRLFSALPYDSLFLFLSVKFCKNEDHTIHHWASIRHMLRRYFFKIAEGHAGDMQTFNWVNNVARRELSDSIKFVLEEINGNYKNIENQYFTLRMKLLE